MSDFSDRPFVAGSLIGMRAFAVDSLGRLIGPSFPQVFAPGENAAECRKDDDPVAALNLAYQRMTLSFDPVRFGGGVLSHGGGRLGENYRKAKAEIERKALSQEAVEREDPPKPPPHTMGGIGCRCGFYAYFDGGNDYKQPDRVTALIEGYGVCTVGDRGFRASKARLVAIVRPGDGVPGMRGDLVLRNYPDVPVFDRMRDALNAHPLSTGHLPSPETADDFWTREATR